jgi:hypothetical protein
MIFTAQSLSPILSSTTEVARVYLNRLVGKGFAFVGRQYRITLGNRNFYVDLVFYHRILKCFVLIDLKKEEHGPVRRISYRQNHHQNWSSLDLLSFKWSRGIQF